MIALDKTGTITKGEPSVSQLHALPGVDEAHLLRMAASAERASEHPLAQAVVAYAQARGISLTQPDSFEAESGRGVRAVVEGVEVAIGSPKWMTSSPDDAHINTWIDALQSQGQTAVVVALNGAGNWRASAPSLPGAVMTGRLR